jgi:hypothetical protein
MAHIQLDIPNLAVNVEDEINQTRVILRQSTLIVNQSEIPIYEFAENALFAITASYALNSGGDSPEEIASLISGTIVTPLEITSSFAGDGSNLFNVKNLSGGSTGHIVLWATDTTLSSSRIIQTGSSIIIGEERIYHPEAPSLLEVNAGITDSYNAIHAHGSIDNYFQTNIRNESTGATASSDVVATANIGDEDRGYINMGINNSGYDTQFIGNALDAYLYSTGSDLLIGNISEGQSIIFFTGGPNVDNTGRMFIGPEGTIGINSREITTGYPETLFIRALNDNTYNLITAKSNVDAYSQINIQNESSGSYASSDIVATADNGGETGNFINFGINSGQYTGDFSGDYGNANDAYLYSTASSGHLHIGEASPIGEVTIFAGSTNFEGSTKLRVRSDDRHELTGSLQLNGQGGMIIFTPQLAPEYIPPGGLFFSSSGELFVGM